MIYLYCRVSTDKQENGRDAQAQRLRDWASDQPYELIVDEDVSAFSVPLNKRPAGKLMCDRLQRGDIVVVTKVDRAFRSTLDMATTRQNWRSLGIHLEIIDLPDAFRTPEGELFLTMKVAFAQYESFQHGQRKREVYAHKRKTGQPYSWTRPYGWKRTKDKRGKLVGYEPDAKEQALGRRVLEMRRAGKSWWSIASDVCLAGDRKPSTREGAGYYHVRDIRSLACAAAAGYPTVPQAVWQESDYAQKLHAMKADGVRLWPEGYAHSEIDPEPDPRLGRDPKLPSRGSQDSPPRAVDPQPLAG